MVAFQQHIYQQYSPCYHYLVPLLLHQCQSGVASLQNLFVIDGNKTVARKFFVGVILRILLLYWKQK
jgi:hypothetical protein